MSTYFVVGRALASGGRAAARGRRHHRGRPGRPAAARADAQDEIHRLAVTLNAMLDRIDAATKRQRTFVGDAAHELRSPLASLRVQLEVAQRVGPRTDWPGMLDDVLFDVDRLDRLVEDLLALARSDEAGGVLRRREPVALDQLVTEVADGLRGRPRAGALIHRRRVCRRRSGGASPRRREPARQRRAIRQHAGDRSTSPSTETARPSWSIRDDGPGMPEDERERVFDRFYRAAESRSRDTGGTGLGLPIVRDLVRAHGGTVSLADNHPGLRATVILPVAGSDEHRLG